MVHYRVYNSTQYVLVWSQIVSMISHLFKINFNIILPFTLRYSKRRLSLLFFPLNPMRGEQYVRVYSDVRCWPLDLQGTRGDIAG